MGSLSPPDMKHLKNFQHMFFNHRHRLTAFREKIMKKSTTIPHNRVHDCSHTIDTSTSSIQSDSPVSDTQPQHQPQMTTNSHTGAGRTLDINIMQINPRSGFSCKRNSSLNDILIGGKLITEGDADQNNAITGEHSDVFNQNLHQDTQLFDIVCQRTQNQETLKQLNSSQQKLNGSQMQHVSLKVLSDSQCEKLTRRRPAKRQQSDRALKPNKEDKMGLTPVHRAAQSGDVSMLNHIITLGGDVNKPTGKSQGYTPPLLYAACEGHTDCVRTLLVSGANPNGHDEWGNTALFKAACYNQVECVKLLLLFGANLGLANKWGALPLQYASLQGYDRVIELLLQYGASISHCHGDTSLPPPVIGAATRCHITSLKLLLQASEPDVRQLESSLTMALYYFLCSCAGFEYTTTLASVNDRFTCIELLVSCGAPIKPEHLKMCCYHHFVPLLNLENYIVMLQFLLRAVAFNAKSSQWNNAMTVIFGHVTRLGPHKWDLLRLICSLGFTPSTDLLNTLKFTLTSDEYRELCGLRRQPRSLTDLSRGVIRSASSNSNVVHNIDQLELPKLVQDIILINNPYFMSL